ncbi:2-dehydropantoate 2-reductase [uncultured Sneathiella sp.]|jgi:2-dehydropantoate 2-reductase|uniref:2-dehydropantoate 2-reductase n=1 Tax=uncultured Sneathiella sp. TaxID=879315 RepID=UPI0030D99EEA|tara:strand:+ start:23268 stop:24248 length:981 start_codon:yes stop_codon:yes gene_type:complete
MKICIYGAGAIGGLIGGLLARKGDAEVSLIARGPHLAAIQKNGLTIKGPEETFTLDNITATDDPAELGPQDYVIIALKAHSVAGIVDKMQPLLGPETAVVAAQNGVPWWYFYGLEGETQDRRVKAVDPDGKIWDGIGPERAIGCVIYQAAEVSEPGVIAHMAGDRFPVGEPTGERTERVKTLSKLLIGAGLKAPVRTDIRSDIWVKLWGNLSFNPISALTGATLDLITGNPETRAVARKMMLEAQAIGESLGVNYPIDVDARIEGAAGVGPHKTSMLVDLESGRPMEIDALVTAVQEMGSITGHATPTIDTVVSLLRQKARLLGCY